MKKPILSIYVEPMMKRGLEQTAEDWGCSVSELVQVLIRWGGHALLIESQAQGRDLDLNALIDGLSRGMHNWGPITPLLEKGE